MTPHLTDNLHGLFANVQTSIALLNAVETLLGVISAGWRLLQVLPTSVFHLLALAWWNSDPLPAFFLQEPGEVHDLADVVGRVSQ